MPGTQPADSVSCLTQSKNLTQEIKLRSAAPNQSQAGTQSLQSEATRSSEIISPSLSQFSSTAFDTSAGSINIYLHEIGGDVEIQGGELQSQVITTLPVNAETSSWLQRELLALDRIIDLDFNLTLNPADLNNADIRLFFDTVIDIGNSNNTLGLALTNSNPSANPRQWWELVLNTPEFSDQSQLRFATLHEFGHSLGLEHPFESSDGDVSGSVFGDPDANVTIMSYTKPSSGWPTTFSPLDYAALATIWGLEDNSTSLWRFRNPDGSEDNLTTEQATQRLAENRPGEALLGSISIPDNQQSVRPINRLSGTPEQDLLEGSEGRDRIKGFADDDVLIGKAGRDRLLGGNGRDQIDGGRGRDQITGGRGGDRLSGGLGRDTFITRINKHSLLNDHDQIVDFNFNQDRIKAAKTSTSRTFLQLGQIDSLAPDQLQSILGIENSSQAQQLLPSDAVALFAVGTGDNSRHFLSINDSNAGFNPRQDAILEISGYSGNPDNLTIL